MQPLKVWLIGQGNLGYDLAQACEKRGLPYSMSSRNVQRLSPDFTNPTEATLIVNTVGGHIDEDVKSLWESNIEFNKKLIKQFPTMPIIAFSSNAALESWRSPYAGVKRALEHLAESSANLFVFRVSSLYGKLKPIHTFPGRLRTRHPKPCALSLPSNPIQPTPTEWLAEKIIRAGSLNPKVHVQDLAPSGMTSPADWARKILGPEYKITDSGIDQTRNAFRVLDGKGNLSWGDLWQKYRN